MSKTEGNRTNERNLKREILSNRSILPIYHEAQRQREIDLHEERPKLRSECRDGPRPCPWVSCRYHLGIEVTRSGFLKLAFKEGPWEMKETCALDVAERRGEQRLEDVASFLGMTRQRIQQIELMVKLKIKALVEGGSHSARCVLHNDRRSVGWLPLCYGCAMDLGGSGLGKQSLGDQISVAEACRRFVEGERKNAPRRF